MPSQRRTESSTRASFASFTDITRGSVVEVDKQGNETDKASLLSSFVNLGNTVMGTGVLALPFAIAQAGMVPGFLFLAMGCVMSSLSLYILGLSALAQGDPGQSFTTLGDRIYPMFSIVVEVGVVLNGIGAAIGYLIVASTSFQLSFHGNRQLWLILGTALAAPLALLRKMDALRFTSALAVVVLILLGIMVFLFYLGGEIDLGKLLDPCANSVKDCRGGTDLIGSTATKVISAFVVFTNAFTCQQSLLPILAELHDPTPRRLGLLIVMSMALVLPLYVVFSVFGFLTYGSTINSNVLDSYPSDALTSVARIGIAIVVITSYPIQVFSMRKSISNIYYTVRAGCCAASKDRATDPEVAHASVPRGSVAESSRVTWADEDHARPADTTICARLRSMFIDDVVELAVALVMTVICFVVALVCSDLGTVVSITGATGAASITFIFPGLFYFVLMAEHGWSTLRIVALGLLIFGFVLVPTSLALIFIDA